VGEPQLDDGEEPDGDGAWTQREHLMALDLEWASG